ncbi:MAG: recombinase family protein [Alphaproteobacteria bacterium]
MTKRKIRCAIYTRKSSEEGLEQDFNSLDAQREACEAYVKSQRHEGWAAISARYDDGGFSGGTMKRPGLQRLMEAIEAGKVDVVVVYKVDRLTRALADFAKIIERFDEKSVSFVSVTQQFNTTSSMGRLTLNMLLSFAQFEREVTGERIRDKIAASKKKGMWMGGSVPLGYQAKDRTLVIDEDEAERVRTLFRLYLELRSVQKVRDEAERLGIRSKSGLIIEPGALYRLLQNPVYIGKIRHKDQIYEGLHDPILDEDTWDAVQQQLEKNRVDRKNGKCARHPSLLASKLFDDTGQPFTPSHAVKDGKRYRYYIERSAVRGGNGVGRPKKKRIAAAEIEGLVADAVRKLLRSPSELVEALAAKGLPPGDVRRFVDNAAGLAGQIGDGTSHAHVPLRQLLRKVGLSDSAVRIEIDRAALGEAVGCSNPDGNRTPYLIDVSAQLRPRGVELKYVIEGPAELRAPNPDPALINVVVSAHRWWNMLLNGEAKTLSELASMEGVSSRYIRRIIKLAFLAPDVVSAILDGRQPPDTTAETVTRQPALPLHWSYHRTTQSR